LIVTLAIHGWEMGCNQCSKIVELQGVVVGSISDWLSIVEILAVRKALHPRTAVFWHAVTLAHFTGVGHD